METRGKYQSRSRFIQANLSVTVLYSHLTWPPTCYWSQSKHKSNSIRVILSSARQVYIALQQINTCSYTCVLEAKDVKVLFFFPTGFFKFIHGKFHLLKSNPWSNQFNTRNQFLTRNNKAYKILDMLHWESCLYIIH